MQGVLFNDKKPSFGPISIETLKARELEREKEWNSFFDKYSVPEQSSKDDGISMTNITIDEKKAGNKNGKAKSKLNKIPKKVSRAIKPKPKPKPKPEPKRRPIPLIPEVSNNPAVSFGNNSTQSSKLQRKSIKLYTGTDSPVDLSTAETPARKNQSTMDLTKKDRCILMNLSENNTPRGTPAFRRRSKLNIPGRKILTRSSERSSLSSTTRTLDSSSASSRRLRVSLKRIDTTCFKFADSETVSPPVSKEPASSMTDDNNAASKSLPLKPSSDNPVRTKSNSFGQDKKFSVSRDEKAKPEIYPERMASVKSFTLSSNRSQVTNDIDGSEKSEIPTPSNSESLGKEKKSIKKSETRTSPESKSPGEEKKPIHKSRPSKPPKSKSPRKNKKPIQKSKSPISEKSQLSDEEKQPVGKSLRSNEMAASQREQHEKDEKRRKRKYYDPDCETDDYEDRRTKLKKELEILKQSKQSTMRFFEESDDETEECSLREYLQLFAQKSKLRKN